MKNAKLVRFLVLLLALCMMVSMFAACATEDEGNETIDGETDDNDISTGGDATADDLDENGFLKDNIPEDFNPCEQQAIAADPAEELQLDDSFSF